MARGRIFPPRYARRMARGGKMGCAVFIVIPIIVILAYSLIKVI